MGGYTISVPKTLRLAARTHFIWRCRCHIYFDVSPQVLERRKEQRFCEVSHTCSVLYSELSTLEWSNGGFVNGLFQCSAYTGVPTDRVVTASNSDGSCVGGNRRHCSIDCVEIHHLHEACLNRGSNSLSSFLCSCQIFEHATRVRRTDSVGM